MLSHKLHVASKTVADCKGKKQMSFLGVIPIFTKKHNMKMK